MYCKSAHICVHIRINSRDDIKSAQTTRFSIYWNPHPLQRSLITSEVFQIIYCFNPKWTIHLNMMIINSMSFLWSWIFQLEICPFWENLYHILAILFICRCHSNGYTRDEKDIDFLVLCQNKQNRKVIANSVTMLSTMFKVFAEKNTELQKKKKKTFLHMVHILNFGP